MNAKKTLVAASLSAALLAAGVAQAGTLTIANAPGKQTNFATEIFGTGSAAQEVYSPDIVYVVGAAIPASTEIRFNLLEGGADGSPAVFNTALTTSHFRVLRNNAGVCDDQSGAVTLVAGGQAGQFFATFRTTTPLVAGDVVVLRLSGANDSLAGVGGCPDMDGAANQPIVAIRNVNRLGSEGATVRASVSIQGGLDATPAAIIATSEYGIELTTGPGSDPGTAPNRTINTATGDLKFSGNAAGTTPFSDFETSVGFNQVGTVSWDVATVDNRIRLAVPAVAAGAWAVTNSAAPGALADHIADPAGDQYAPDGADTVTMTLTSSVDDGFAPFLASGGQVRLSTGACSATNSGTSPAVLAPLAGATADSYSFNVTGNTIQGNTYNVCLVTPGTKAILPQSFDATLSYNNAEPTYQDPSFVDGAGSIARNGCLVDIPNVPASNNTQEATFLRLFNKSASVSGPVRVVVYGQDGSVIGENAKLIKDSLKPHETAVWTVKELETALGVQPWSGRARVTFLNGFDTCDGMGLLRTVTSGELKNFSTSTHQERNGQ